jgi:hypothetical protein
MACHAMPRMRQPAGLAPGEPRGTPAAAGVPWWGVVSSVVAPALLVSAWTFAAGVQRGAYNAVADTVSALAASGAADRWVMTPQTPGRAQLWWDTGRRL